MALLTETGTTRCCIVGGGPAGMMLGYLLARAGVPTVVLKMHADFLRDCHGDTVIQNNLLVRVLGRRAGDPLEVPLPLRVLTAIPTLQRLFDRLLGMGVRPEHMCSPKV